ncbi:hypothetical protein B0T20DRAFT_116400 [Sordaria brevicollis]|uniref:Uncharacterized protein n=1 Tax=Sordaria brevicollis TaxID=83679 RepID=A0AAE0PK61_SORBR|nr:hypothetical protein B0T20DRAFT_116400 [Sordaria brevicollis]
MVKPQHLHHRRFPFEKRKHVRVLKRRNRLPVLAKVALAVDAWSIEPKGQTPVPRARISPAAFAFFVVVVGLDVFPAKRVSNISTLLTNLAECHRKQAGRNRGGCDPRIWGNGPPSTRGHARLNLSNAGSKDQCNPSIPRLTGPQAML